MANWKTPNHRPDPSPTGQPAVIYQQAVSGSHGGVNQVVVRNITDLTTNTAPHPLQQLAQACTAILAGAAEPVFPGSHRASPSPIVMIYRQACPLPRGIPDAIFPLQVGWQAWQVIHPVVLAYGTVGGWTRPVGRAVEQLESELQAALEAAGFRVTP